MSDNGICSTTNGYLFLINDRDSDDRSTKSLELLDEALIATVNMEQLVNLRRAFGDESREPPPVTALIVAADADNTAGSSLAHVGGLRFEP